MQHREINAARQIVTQAKRLLSYCASSDSRKECKHSKLINVLTKVEKKLVASNVYKMEYTPTPDEGDDPSVSAPQIKLGEDGQAAVVELRQVAEMLGAMVPLFMSVECSNDKAMDFAPDLMHERTQACRRVGYPLGNWVDVLLVERQARISFDVHAPEELVKVLSNDPAEDLQGVWRLQAWPEVMAKAQTRLLSEYLCEVLLYCDEGVENEPLLVTFTKLVSEKKRAVP